MSRATIVLLAITSAVVAFAVTFGVVRLAHADAILTQSSAATEEIPGTTSDTQSLGTGISGTASYLTLAASTTQSSLVINTQFVRCDVDNVSDGSCVGTVLGAYTLSNTGIQYSTKIFSNYTFDASKYYFIVIQPTGSSGQVGLMGTTNAAAYVNGQLSSGTRNIKDAYFVIGSSNVVALQPQVYAFTDPDQFEVTATADVPVSFTYLNTTEYDRVGVQVTDQSNAGLLLSTGETSASQSGLYTYSDVLSLSSNHAYRIRGYLKDSSSGARVYGPYRDFSTVSDQFFNASSTLINISGVNDGNASSTLQQGINSFSNLPGYLSRRIPWGYFYDISAIYHSAATTSTTFSALSVDFAGSNISTSTKSFLPSSFTFLSTTTVTQYFPSGLLSAFNALASAALYVSTMAAIFFRLRGLTPSAS